MGHPFHSCSELFAQIGLINSPEEIGDFLCEHIPLQQAGVPGCYTTWYINGQFTAVCESEHIPGVHLTLCMSFLEDVVEHADDYIEHPEKLDCSWLSNR
jgi:hypothetical protein